MSSQTYQENHHEQHAPFVWIGGRSFGDCSAAVKGLRGFPYQEGRTMQHKLYRIHMWYCTKCRTGFDAAIAIRRRRLHCPLCNALLERREKTVRLRRHERLATVGFAGGSS